MKQALTELKGETDNSAMRAGDLDIPCSTTDHLIDEKGNRESEHYRPHGPKGI